MGYILQQHWQQIQQKKEQEQAQQQEEGQVAENGEAGVETNASAQHGHGQEQLGHSAGGRAIADTRESQSSGDSIAWEK